MIKIFTNLEKKKNSSLCGKIRKIGLPVVKIGRRKCVTQEAQIFHILQFFPDFFR